MQSPQEQPIDWTQECPSSGYAYLLPNQPEVIGRAVTGAVSQVLTSSQHSDDALRSFIDESSYKDEENEALARQILGQGAPSAQSDGYHQAEWEEAVRQGQLAQDKFEAYQREPDRFHFHDFMPELDYWAGRPVRLDMYIHENRHEQGTAILIAPIPKLGDLVGFPETMLDYGSPYGEEARIDDFVSSLATILGEEPDTLVAEVANNPHSQIMFLDEVAGDDNCSVEPELREVIRKVYRREEPDKNHLPEAQKLLEGSGSQAIHQPREVTLSGEHTYPIRVGSTTADLRIRWHAPAEVKYDPDAQCLHGEPDPGTCGSVWAQLRPHVTSKTNHQELLSIKSRGEELCQQLGLPVGNDQQNVWLQE
jgi:hypothetical protein